MIESEAGDRTTPSRVLDVFMTFLGLGLTSFGGPIAHLGYFREAFVVRRQWLSERAYVDLVALCQFLPGPTSSQVGMAIGLRQAGYAGMLAAWLGFTLPSALALIIFAYGLQAWGIGADAPWIDGLKAAAVAVVAVAVLGMARSLTPDKERATIAVLGMILALVVAGAWGQVAAIVLGGLLGLVWLRPVELPPEPEDHLTVPVSRAAATGALVAFAVLLLGLPLLSHLNVTLSIIDSFYRAGSLVFGGGHVVLPLLQAEVVEPGLVNHDVFLAGYGAAQAVPGPLFTFAAFLGTVMQSGPSGVLGGLIALVAIFVPSALLIVGALPFWEMLRAAPMARRALMGINAGVVGLLAAALYDPVFTEGITSPMALAIAAVAFVLLHMWKTPPWLVVVLAGVAGQFLL